MRKALIIFSVLFFGISISSFKTTKEKSISEFKLKSATSNKNIALSDYKNAKGFIVVFTCNKCPMAKLYIKRMNELNSKYSKLGISLLAVNSMDTLAYFEESFKRMQKKAKSENFNFPYLQDKKQTVVKQFGATHTPQSFVIWKNNKGTFDIKYQGAIDDNASTPENAENHYLTEAVDELLKGKSVTIKSTESFGCRIYIRGEKQVH